MPNAARKRSAVAVEDDIACHAPGPWPGSAAATDEECGPRYVADRHAERLSVTMDGLEILFHRPSGQTHILAEPAPTLLALLSDGPLGAGALVARLGIAGADVEAARALVAQRLEELRAVGLVRLA